MIKKKIFVFSFLRVRVLPQLTLQAMGQGYKLSAAVLSTFSKGNRKSEETVAPFFVGSVQRPRRRHSRETNDAKRTE